MWSPFYPANENKQVLVGLVLMPLVANTMVRAETVDNVAGSKPTIKTGVTTVSIADILPVLF